MWQELVQQVGVIWIILVFLTTAGLIALTAFFFITLRGLALASRKRFQQLDLDVDALESCRIENLKTVQELVSQQMNEDFKKYFDRLAEDSTAMFGSIWVPDPSSRLPLPDVLPAPARAVFRKTLGSAVILGGVAVSALALSTGYVINGSLADAAFLRFLALMPLVISGIGMLILHQAGEEYYRQIQHAWKLLMVSLERRLPVYSQAAETAIMLNNMKEYDARMSSSVQILADQVKHLTSGKLSDAVSNAVKYVMSATVAPAVIKSTEALALLAQQLETKQMQADQAVARLYAEMENRQHKQSDLWFKRYQEISEVLEEQQNKLLQNLAAGQQEMVDNLSKGQALSLEKINDEQHKTLMFVNSTTQKAWSVLQEKLTQIITQLAEGQTKLLTGLNEQQQQTLTRVSDTSEQTAATLRQQYDSILDKMRQTQTDIWEQLAGRQTQAYDSLLAQQKESFGAVTAQQQQAYQQAAQAQQEGLLLMRSQQGEAIRQITDSQADILKDIDQRQNAALEKISEHQATSLQTISGQQAAALQQLISVQSVTLNGIHKNQEESFAQMAGRQQEALQQLADRFAGEVSGTLAEYLDPVTTRLKESSEALIAAQAYARDVKEVLKLQNESATTLQVSIRDLFGQLVETRRGMSEDLVSLKASSGIMSKAAESMSSVYAGSQSGLSEAISQMSNDLMRLSDVLSAVMAGSAEQTRLMQSQSMETYEINQKHLDAVREQITFLSDELSTRIDQLMIGFTSLTQELVKNIDSTLMNQNDTLGGSMRSLTDLMGEEARSMSLFAQQINMDIETLNDGLKTSVSDFNSGVRNELSVALNQFDSEVADIVRRLARSAVELGDAVEALPAAIRHVSSPELPDPRQPAGS